MLRRTVLTQWMLVLLVGCGLAAFGCRSEPAPPADDVDDDTGGAVGDVCETNADCADDLLCEEGVCVEPVPVGCETNEDCAEGEVCEDGDCVAAPEGECEFDEDCAEGEICADGDCVEAPDDGADGAALYAANCACHGPDGAGPPDIRGLSAADLAAGLASPTHGTIELTDDEVAAIAEFLGG
ncbi:MAG: cytochrome c [Phycisphaerales bacterium]|nr:MAG: cytochrome c [Phycisphaerales bacterium]